MIIKILSYNLHKGFTFANREFVLSEIRRALRETHADILFLQEVVGHHSHSKHKIPEWETTIQFEYLADSVWSHFAYGKNAVYDEGHHGNAILSKFPILKWENFSISTNRFESRGLIRANVQLPNGQELVIANTHLDLLQRGRNIQVQQIITQMQVETNLPWILVGDFNDSALGAQEVFKVLHGTYPATYPSFYPVLSLDRIFCHSLTPVKAVALTDDKWKKMSDHLPLYVELDLKLDDETTDPMGKINV
jgi:endonuclease/exonuclease/phosphatase family metal-dependent hydrolase